MKLLKITTIVTVATVIGLVAQGAERVYLSTADDNFKKNGTFNTFDAENNQFTIASSYGSVYWSMSSIGSLEDFQWLVVRLKSVENNNIRIEIKDRKSRVYVHNVEPALLDTPQEIIIDLMRPLYDSDTGAQLDLSNISRIQFWNYWDTGDGIESATVTIDEMFLEPYGSQEIMLSNPVVQTNYTTDPAPMVWNDRVWLFTGHDDDGAEYFEMNNWRLYSTQDMVNWTDHGSPMDWSIYSWCDGQAWAAQAIERNGKLYWYTSSNSKAKNYHVVGVAVADHPEGPWEPGRSTALTNMYGDIDPTAFIDEDGQAYLYCGNNCLHYALLNEDMVSLDGNEMNYELTEEAFGGVKVDGVVQGENCFEEGPWFYRRGDIYYLVYAAGGVPENLAYSTSDSPLGPWRYQGIIMPTQGGSFTNHPGILEYKGHNYLFYHNGFLPGGGGFQRSVAIEEFEYGADGSIPQMNMTCIGVKPIATLSPYQRQEAETIALSYGLKTAPADGIDEGTIGASQSRNNQVLTKVDNGDYWLVREVEFGDEGANEMRAILRGINGGVISVYLDNPKGNPIATFAVDANTDWQEMTAPLQDTVTGKHVLYFVASGEGSDQLEMDCWIFANASDNSVGSIVADYAYSMKKGIYTLDGRKIEEIVSPGFYIKDGQKILVK